MYKDVQNSNNVDKQMLNQLVNENVTVLTQNKSDEGFIKKIILNPVFST